MIKRIKLLINEMRWLQESIQSGVEARMNASTTVYESLLKSIEPQKPGLFHRDAKHRAFLRKLAANHRSRKLHKAILAGKAPRGRTV